MLIRPDTNGTEWETGKAEDHITDYTNPDLDHDRGEGEEHNHHEQADQQAGLRLEPAWRDSLIVLEQNTIKFVLYSTVYINLQRWARVPEMFSRPA